MNMLLFVYPSIYYYIVRKDKTLIMHTLAGFLYIPAALYENEINHLKPHDRACFQPTS
jgi:hypothetical protein